MSYDQAERTGNGRSGLDAASRLRSMNRLLARNWWALALRGAAAILLGVLALLMPGVTVATLALTFSAYLLLDGVFAILAGIRASRHHERALPFILEGAVSLVAGIVAALWPAASLFALVFLIAAWSVVTGFAEVMGAWRMDRTHGKWAWGVAGALSILFGLSLWVLPALGLLALAWGVAAYLIAFGVLALVTAFRLRHCHRENSASGGGGMAAAV
ncbi:HdeD family acid-resistance protein [Azospirillum sp. B506]|uniref:HdeD family acid-resistance protein n=1 Tax=Azospirillum sp. B506 TaxID=137721 RepID=UPI0003450506|nr:HdeD family acid-resistance protein [Azospirillum sp. B506]